MIKGEIDDQTLVEVSLCAGIGSRDVVMMSTQAIEKGGTGACDEFGIRMQCCGAGVFVGAVLRAGAYYDSDDYQLSVSTLIYF